MKVLILTKSNYAVEFIANITYQHPEHEFFIWTGDDSVWERIEAYDIGISFMYTHKIPAKEVNSHPWFNFHPGPLPEYKGRNLCYHAIMNGEEKFGATLHYMDENFDTGPIIDVWRFDIEPYMTAREVSRDAVETAKAMFEEYFPQILEDFPFATIPNVGGRYYKKEPINEYVQGDKLIKNVIRAVYFPPHYPKIEIGGLTYKIVRDE